MDQGMSAAERALGLALTNAMRPTWDLEEAARRLAESSRPIALRQALAKLRRTLEARPSPIGLRAEQTLFEALSLVSDRPAAVEAV